MYRINELLKADQKIFHTSDLAVLWGIDNQNTLYTTIKRYMQKGILIPIYKGLYATVSISRLDPLLLGKAIAHRYTYLTTESILWQAGIISQKIYDYTFAADICKYVVVGPWLYRFRQLKDEYLHNPTGIYEHNGVFVASTERAVADMLYFNPIYRFDNLQGIDFDKVREIQKETGYPYGKF